MTVRIDGSTPQTQVGLDHEVATQIDTAPDAQQLNEMVQVIRSLDFGIPGWSGGYVPTLAPPTMDPEAVIAMLGMAQNYLQNAAVRNQGELIKSNMAQRETHHKDALKEMATMLEKAIEAAAKQGQDRIAGWFRAVFGVIGAVLGAVLATAAAVASGGLAIAGAVGAFVGVTMAVLDLANQIAMEVGATMTDAEGKTKALDISIGGMVAAIVDQQIKDGTIKFSSDKQKQDYLTGWTITANLLVMAAVVCSGAVGMKGFFKDAAKLATEGMKAVDKMQDSGQLADRLARAAEGLVMIGEGSAVATQGAVRIQTAEIQFSAAEARAKHLFFDQMFRSASERISQHIDVLANQSKSFEETWAWIANQIHALHQAQMTSTRNMA